MNFTKYVDHVGHGNELRSTVRNGLIPVGFSTKTESYAVFFTLVDPMNVEQGLRETFCDLAQARIAPYKNIWKHLRNTGFRETFCDLSQARIAPYKNIWKHLRNTGLRETFCDLSQARIAPYKNIWKHLRNTGFRETFCDLSQARIAPYKNIWKHLRNTGFRETFCDLSQARIAPYKNTCKHLQNTVHWCNLLPARERGLRFYQTRSNAVVLCDTLPAEFIEKAVCMKTKEQLYQREKRKTSVMNARNHFFKI